MEDKGTGRQEDRITEGKEDRRTASQVDRGMRTEGQDRWDSSLADSNYY